MKFELHGKIILNKQMKDSEFQADFAEFIKHANATFLTKGAPENMGAKVTDWAIKEDHIQLVIQSGSYVRPHDALLRLKKNFGQTFGKKYKLGARSVIADEYKIDIPITQRSLKEFRLPLVDTLQIDNDNLRCRFTFKNVNEEFLRENYIDRIIRLINDKIAKQYYEGKDTRWEVMWSSEERPHVWTKDPTEEMAKLGWIKQGPTKGKWFYRPEFTAILRTMEKIALDEILLPLGFQEVIQSHIVPFEVWLRTGHMEGAPNEFYYVSEPKSRDVAVWEELMDYVTISHQVPEDKLQELISTPKAGICYAQCPGIYWSFQGRVIADESLPVLIYDRAANSNRYESGGRHGIERVDEFHRLEPIYIGHPEQLIELRDKLTERYKYVFNELLELEWRMAWVTPWYMEQSGQVSEDDGSEKVKGTIDYEAYLPYRGSRKESEWLEYQNLSIIGDKFIKAFNIKCQHGDLWSGCSGIGLERWAAVFLAQKGIDPTNWPEKFKKKFGEFPKGIKIL